MPADLEFAYKVISEIAAQMPGGPKTIKDLLYRNNYQDYMVLMNDNTFCAIREKIIQDYPTDKTGDRKREIEFQLRHAEVCDEFNEYFDLEPQAKPEEKMQVDDDVGTGG